MSSWLRRSLCACVAAALAAGPAARPAAAAAATPQEVDAALKKGKAYLYSQLKGDNCELVPKFPPGQKEQYQVAGWQWGGVTATAVYGLLAAGENPKNEPRLKAAVEWLKTAEIHGHYASAMRAQVWHYLKDEKEAKLSSKRDRDILLNALIDKNPGFGFYSYYTDEKGKPQTGWFDRSVSQIAVLGVWATEQAGQEIPSKYWEIVDAAWKKAQRADGGWNYQDGPQMAGSTGTMTAAGVATLFITQDELMQSETGRFSACRGGQRNDSIERGLAWMDKNAPQLLINAPEYYYQLYGIERIGVASGRKYFGTTDWYRVGAEQLVKKQSPDGSWGNDEPGHNPKKVPDTVFAMLFLLRGRAPVIMNKLEYAIAAEGKQKAPADPWNQRPRDVANFTAWAGKQTEDYFNWQVVNLKVSAADLHDAPILYLAGSLPLRFTPDETAKLREFVEGGGVILGNADCGNALFTKSFVDLGKELFPKYEMRELPKSHSIYVDQPFKPAKWHAHPKLLGVTNGVRELMLLVPDADLGKAWQLRSDKTKVESYELMEDIFLYTVDKTGLQFRGQTNMVARDDKVPAERSMSVARLMVGDNPDPEPGAWRRIANVAHNELKLDLKVEPVKLGDGKLGAGYKLAHLTGTTKFKLGDAQKAELADFVKKGGTLLVDAAGGSNDFADAAEQELAAVFGGTGQQVGPVLPPDHPLFAAAKKIDKFTYRTFTKNKVSGKLDAPRLQAHLVDGRPAVLYSREDLTEGMVGQAVDGVIGYSPETATDVVRSVLGYLAGPLKKPAPATKPGENKAEEKKPVGKDEKK
jgi:hypothetical protein